MQQRHANLRKLAIHSAESRIATHGIHSLNARFVAKEIGCSVGTLYNLFKNLDFLIFAVNLKTLSTLEAALKQASHASKNSLQTITNAYIEFAQAHPNLWLTLFEHQFTNADDTPKDYYQLRTSLFHILEAQIKHVHPNLTAQEVALEARALWAGVHGICMLNITNKLDDDGYSLQDIVTTLVMKFMGTKEGETA